MIKGITLVTQVAALDRLSALFSVLGFEPGKGWDEAPQGGTGKGAAFLAPLGNLELVAGRAPAVPPVLVEVTHLDEVRTAVVQWAASDGTGVAVGEIAETHWKSRLFTVELDPSLKLGFWEHENPLHGRPVAIEGDLSAVGMRFGVVVARWNAVITDRLLAGALDALYRSGAAKADVEIVRVPGAWEIPAAARALAQTTGAETKRVDAIVTLGCLLRGETAHYEAIYNEVARGIGQSQQETGVPHAFGVLTCETLEQALDRAGVKAGNKGFEAGIAAIEMVSVTKKLQAPEKIAVSA